MEIIVFDKPSYYKMQNELLNMFKEAMKEVQKQKEWLNTEEAKELLGIRSKSKMQKLRDSGEIKFSQNARTIMYSRGSILDYLESNVPKF